MGGTLRVFISWDRPKSDDIPQFWSTTIADALIQIVGLFLLQESTVLVSSHPYLSLLTFGSVIAFAPLLLEREANAIRQTMNLETGPVKRVRTVYDTEDRQYVLDHHLINNKPRLT